jgi:hypothetical protein
MVAASGAYASCHGIVYGAEIVAATPAICLKNKAWQFEQQSRLRNEASSRDPSIVLKGQNSLRQDRSAYRPVAAIVLPEVKKMNGEVPDRPSLVLSVNRAPWGEVSSRLRSVQVEYREGSIRLYCYFDGETAEDDNESMSVAGTEVSSDFPDYVVEEHCIRVDAPERVPHEKGRHIVFERKEKE